LISGNETRNFIIFLSSRRRHTSCYRDWSSDVFSSDLDPIHHRIKICTESPSPAVGQFPNLAQDKSVCELGIQRTSLLTKIRGIRSEERRVGKECRCRWGASCGVN